MELERASAQILRGKTIEQALEKFDWKDFEDTVGNIFSQNGFSVRRNFRFKTKKRHEIDLVAAKGNVVFCVDCKRWSNGREKFWGLRKAAVFQETRAKELRRFLRRNIIASSAMKISSEKFVPMIATLHEERLLKYGRVLVVPVRKLNAFLLEHENLV